MTKPFVVLALIVPLAVAVTGVGRLSARRASIAGTIELDVVAIDGQGKPVQGLRSEDFRVKENGKAVTIDSFSERAALGAFGRSDARSVVLILDDTGIPPVLTQRVQSIAHLFVDRVGPDDRLSVVRFNHRGDEVTGDRSTALSRIADYYGGMVPHFGRETLENALTRVAEISRQLEPDWTSAERDRVHRRSGRL